MKGKFLVGLSWVFTVLLIFGTVIAQLVLRQGTVFLTIESNQPGGYSLLAEYLKEGGYSISLENDSLSKLPANSLVIVMGEYRPLDWIFKSQADSANLLPKERELKNALASGCVFMRLDEPREVATASSRVTYNARWQSNRKPIGKLQGESEAATWRSSGYDGDVYPDSVPMITSDTISVAELDAGPNGTLYRYLLSETLMNETLDLDDNAKVFYALVGKIAPSKNIIFFEPNSSSGREKSFWQILGPWAHVLFWQAILWIATFAWIHAVTFGLPLFPRLKERGTREFVDALGYNLQRTNNMPAAIELLKQEIDQRIRRIARLPSDTPVITALKNWGEEALADYKFAFHDPATWNDAKQAAMERTLLRIAAYERRRR